MVFLVVMYGCESWSIKKAECWRIDAFELWCWRRLFRVLWTARRSNQSILKEISPEYSLEGLMLKLQYFGHLMQRTDSFEKTLMLGKSEGRRERGRQRMRWLMASPSWTWVWVNSGSWWWTGRPGVLQSMRSQKVGHDWVTELNWTEKSSQVQRKFLQVVLYSSFCLLGNHLVIVFEETSCVICKIIYQVKVDIFHEERNWGYKFILASGYL